MEIDDLMIEVLHSMEDAADTHIPQPKTFNLSMKNTSRTGILNSRVTEIKLSSGTQCGCLLADRKMANIY